MAFWEICRHQFFILRLTDLYHQNKTTDRYIADRHYFDELGLEAFDNIFLSSFASSKESNSYEFQMIVKLWLPRFLRRRDTTSVLAIKYKNRSALTQWRSLLSSFESCAAATLLTMTTYYVSGLRARIVRILKIRYVEKPMHFFHISDLLIKVDIIIEQR